MRAIFRWSVTDRLLRRRRVHPPGPPAPSAEPDLALIGKRGGPPRLTWIGHSSFLGSLGSSHFLIDPVFSPRAGGFVPRHVSPGLRPGDLPPLDALMVTHSHYDHLDRRSIAGLARSTPVFVPLGLGCWFRRRGFDNVTELDWWQSDRSGDLSITLVPARHWSRRRLLDTNRTLWGGFVIRSGDASVYHSGDSAWFDGFAEIGRRFPGLGTALLPIGAYSPRWFMEHHHMNPEQAGEAFLTLGARRMIPMHWGTFKLTDEPLREPVERLRRWWAREERAPLRLIVPAVGQTVRLE